MDLPAACDPNNDCWPAFKLDRPVYEHYVDDPQTYCKAIYAKFEGVFATKKHIYGCYVRNDHMCRIILPKVLPARALARGWTVETVRAHELNHCARGQFHD